MSIMKKVKSLSRISSKVVPIMLVGLVSVTSLGLIQVQASDLGSTKVMEVIKKTSPVMNTQAKPAPQIRILIDGKAQTLKDPVVMENGRVFLPVRNLGELLGINIDYMANTKVAVAQNSEAYLELPLGYNEAVKDKTVILPIDTANKSTRILSYSNRTYLPVRFISENLGYQIAYGNNTVSITTDGSAPVLPTEPEAPKPDANGIVPIDVSAMNPSDPFNAENIKAFKAGRAPEALQSITFGELTRPSGIDDATWTQIQGNIKKFPTAKTILVSGKLSDIPHHINSKDKMGPGANEISNPRVDWIHPITTDPNTGLLKGGNSSAPVTITYKDGSVSLPNAGADISVGKDVNHKRYPGKTVNDIAFITISDYTFIPTGN